MARRMKRTSSMVLQEPSADSLEQEQSGSLPPRRVVHPSNRGKLSRYFYNTLMVLFVLLTIGLTIWGINFRTDLLE